MGKKKERGFFRDMIAGGNGHVSSKRVLGSFILTVLTIAIVINIFVGADNSQWIGNAVDTLIITSGALLGLGIADKAFDRFQIGLKNENNGKKKDEEFDEPDDTESYNGDN